MLNILPIHLTNVSFRNAGRNIGVTCVRCQGEFDAAPGGDGTFNTVNGRIQRVVAAARSLREALATAPVEELQQLAAADAATLRDSPGLFPTLEAWARRNPALFMLLVAVPAVLSLVVDIAMLMKGSGPATSTQITVQVPSDADLAARIAAAVEAQMSVTATATIQPGP